MRDLKIWRNKLRGLPGVVETGVQSPPNCDLPSTWESDVPFSRPLPSCLWEEQTPGTSAAQGSSPTRTCTRPHSSPAKLSHGCLGSWLLVQRMIRTLHLLSQVTRAIVFSAGISTMLGVQTVFNKCVSNEWLYVQFANVTVNHKPKVHYAV